MIHLILGDVGSGKTTTCEKILEELERRGFSCGGVLCPSVFEGGRKTGTVVVDVASKEKSNFCFRKSKGGCKGAEFCDWVFTEEGVEFGLRALRRGLRCDVVFVDEVGPLELSGGGFAPMLSELFSSGRDVIVAMKRHIKQRFYRTYSGVKAREYDITSREEIVDSIVLRIQDGI